MPPLSVKLDSAVLYAGVKPTWSRPLKLLAVVNFATYFFFRDKLPINKKMLVFFRAKCVWTAIKIMVVNKKTREHQLCYISGGDRCEILRTQAVRRPSRTDNKDEVLRQIELFA